MLQHLPKRSLNMVVLPCIGHRFSSAERIVALGIVQPSMGNGVHTQESTLQNLRT